MQKRGQAAMEFLMTYGWALLVVLIAIGALAFFGVLNPSKFLPQSCVLGPGLACEDFKIVDDPTGITDNDRIYINVRNGMGRNLDMFAIYIGKDTPDGNEVCGGSAGIIAAGPDISTNPQTNNNVLTDPPFSYTLFLDGSLRQIKSAQTAILPLIDGINCNLQGAAIAANCCSLNLAFNNLCGGALACVCDYNCVPSTPLPKTGSKFSGDLIIVYKEQGSQILHQRVGRLTAQIE